MRLRGPFVTIGALGLAVLAVGLVAVWTSIGRVQAIRAMALSATITVEPGIKETFAPPPADAAPAMTAEEAWAQMDNRSIPSDTSAQLGLLTVPVGPDCG